MIADRAVARRYAEAFVSTVETAERLEPGLEELQSAAKIYAEFKDFRRFLGSPEISLEDKQRLLERLWSGTLSQETMALLHLLLKWDRVEQLPAVAEEAVKAAEARQGILRGRVTTAHPISSAEAQALADALGKRLGKRVTLERRLDPALIGGARMTVGTTLLDGSVRAHLEKVRQQLLETKVA